MIGSVYIHIPFCEQICHYCDFTKFFYNEKLANEYLGALEREIATNLPEKKYRARTIFIGGGTPTALNVNQLKKLMEIINSHFDIHTCEEFTIEANPGDFDEDKIKLLDTYGVNRVSLGVQVFDDQLLKSIGRSHSVKDVFQTMDALTKNGFSNISMDLIYALPNQTVDNFRETLDKALAFDLPHYSSYALQVEPKTVFYQRYKKGKLRLPPQDEEVSMYEMLQEGMQKKGLKQYEISNFAKPGYASKHNLTYWNNDYYYGFGAGAHGYLPGERIINIRPLPAYVKQATENGKPVLQIEKIGLKEKVEEEMFLGLRKLEGINKQEFAGKFGFPYDKLYREKIMHLMQTGWLTEKEGHIRLTKEGILFGNEVFEQFLLDESDLARVR